MGKGANDVGLSSLHIVESVEASLKRLGTDYIDLYQIHRPDYLTNFEDALRALDDLVRAGKVRYIGCSNLPAWYLMKSLARRVARARARALPLHAVVLLARRLLVSNSSSSGGEGELHEVPTVGDPSRLAWIRRGDRALAGERQRRAAVQRRINAFRVVVPPELDQLPLQVAGIPEWDVIEELSARRSNFAGRPRRCSPPWRKTAQVSSRGERAWLRCTGRRGSSADSTRMGR